MTTRKFLDFDDSRELYKHDEASSECLIESHSSEPLQTQCQRQKRWTWPVLNKVLLCFNFVLVIALLGSIVASQRQSPHVQSPAQDAIQYQTTYFDKYGHLTSEFSKKPGPELDQAWHNQLSGMNIRVSEDWLKPFEAQSVRLADGSGVLAQLGVYHELHCLKKIKHWIYRPYYHANISGGELEEQEAHIEHCLEWLRVAALCRGDTTLTTFQWSDAKPGLLETEYPVPRQCVNWDELLQWSEEHAVDITENGLLEVP